MATVRPLDLVARSPMVVCDLETFTAKASEREFSSKYLAKCSAGTIGTDMKCVVVVVAELRPDVWPEVWSIIHSVYAQ